MGGTHKIFADIDVDGEVKGTSLDLNGNAQIDGTITVGQDDTGYDVKFFLAASGRYIMIDEDDNSLLFTDNANAKWGNGGDLQISHDSANSRIDNMVGHLRIRNYHNDSDILFETDNGSGGTTEYLRFDGGITSIVASKDLLMGVDGDGGKIKLGASQDLQIYHDGTNSYIQNETGQLYIVNKADDKDIEFQSDDGSGGLATYFMLDGDNTLVEFSKGAQFGSGSYVKLVDNIVAYFGTNNDTQMYHDNSNFYIDNIIGDQDIIFKGTDGSSDITALTLDMSDAGTAIFNHDIKLADNNKAFFGGGTDLSIYHDGSNSYILHNGDTGNLVIQNSLDDTDIIFK